ncbi:D-alanine--D-alanine ligase [invertebrate metagenome]|uniref:D-alanine--D-alanine ligase n=1 Tax=invertebrate metagenome TaxID=1711999 RepID=A0A2H9TD57_9ZZZZ
MASEHPIVGIVCGGPSPEADVSRLSAARIIKPLSKIFAAVQLELDQYLPEQLIKNSIDVVFPVAHGPMGEDGSLQGLLDIMGIPYVGSSVLGSACAMDKSVTKRILQHSGIPVAKDVLVCEWENIDDSVQRCIDSLGTNLIIKPADLGSGIGVQFINNIDELRDGLESGLECHPKLLVEERIYGREITAGVLDTGQITALPVIEITTPDGAWYDYVHRYTPGLSQHTIPARIPDIQYKRVQDIALKAHNLLECRDLSRSDFIVPEVGQPIIAEVNNLPGMTPTSLFPDGAKAAGIEFEDLLKRLVLHAFKRGNRLQERLQRWTLPTLAV